MAATAPHVNAVPFNLKPTNGFVPVKDRDIVDKRRIVLLGATGYTGKRVLRELLARGDNPPWSDETAPGCWP
jgi:hypothetical protein